MSKLILISDPLVSMSTEELASRDEYVFNVLEHNKKLKKNMSELQAQLRRKESENGAFERTIRNQQLEIERLKRRIAELESR